MTWKWKHPGRLAGAIGGMLCMQLAAAQTLDELYKAGEQRIEQAQAQQQEIESVVDVTEDIFDDYQRLLLQIEDLKVYNQVLQAQVDAQNRKLDELNQSIEDAGSIQRQILPLMTRMISGLEHFIDLDMPFLLDERHERVDRLRQTLARSDSTPAQQFRAVLEAWLLEMNDYGTTGETYKDSITTPDGVEREVDVLRIGRVALLYVTPDNSQAGAWDKASHQWVPLDAEMAQQIRTGIDSYKTGQPALFLAPVAPPEE